jgi:hypothetical protein
LTRVDGEQFSIGNILEYHGSAAGMILLHLRASSHSCKSSAAQERRVCCGTPERLLQYALEKASENQHGDGRAEAEKERRTSKSQEAEDERQTTGWSPVGEPAADWIGDQ